MPACSLTKKRRLIIETEPSDDDNAPPPPKSARTTSLSTRITRSTPSTAHDSSLIPNCDVGLHPEPGRVTPRTAQGSSINNNNSEHLQPEQTQPTPRNGATKPGSRTLQSYFIAPQPPPLTAPNLPMRLSLSLPHEDLNDLIEDCFSDSDSLPSNAGDIRVSGSGIATQKGRSTSDANDDGADLPVSAGPVLEYKQRTHVLSTRRNSVGGVQGYKSSDTAVPETKTVEAVFVDSRTWPERFPPQSADDLAVHPRKVSEVRSWLNHVFDGFSKQRLLVLKGSAGVGKTATINVLSKELGFEILEWGNPVNPSLKDIYLGGGEFGTGLAGIFEEFIGRASRFGSLELAPTSSDFARTASQKKSLPDGGEKRVVLIEDFPNTIFTSSQAPLASFRHSIRSFLSSPVPVHASLPPLILIVSESTPISGSSAFTAHCLLSPEILNHPLVTSISFNKIAPTFMVKALSATLTRESHKSGRKLWPSKPLMEALTSSGDIRSAIMSLEFLAINGELGAFSEAASKTKPRRRLGGGELTELEQKTLTGVTQREASFGIFHAIGKIVHNKRYGDDLEDVYVTPPPKPSLNFHPYRTRASRVDINSLIDEAGTDPQTLISGLHENYLGSCNFLGGFTSQTHSLEDLLDCVNCCIGDLSDSDILASSRPYYKNHSAWNTGSSGEAFGGFAGATGIRQDDISFQIAVRGLILALPSPVKREFKDNKIFYPTSLRLWKTKEEIEGLIDLINQKLSRLPGYVHPGVLGSGNLDLVLEIFPYLKTIMRVMRGQQGTAAKRTSFGMKLFEMASKFGGELMRDLEKVTVFRGIQKPSDDFPDDEEPTEIPNESQASEKGTGIEHAPPLWQMIGEKEPTNQLDPIAIESLILSDDDIVDDW